MSEDEREFKARQLGDSALARHRRRCAALLCAEDVRGRAGRGFDPFTHIDFPYLAEQIDGSSKGTLREICRRLLDTLEETLREGDDDS